MNDARLRRSVPLLAAVALLVAGCGADHEAAAPIVVGTASGDTAWQPTASAAATSGTSENARLLGIYGPAPLDAFTWTDEQEATVARAENVLMRKCLSAKGFSEYFASSGVESSTEPAVHWQDYLQLVDPARAKATAYQWSMGSAAATDAAMAAEVAASSAANWTADDWQRYQHALDGPDGCGSQVSTTLAQVDKKVDLSLQGTLLQEAIDRTANDSRVRTAHDAWSACMAAAGYSLTDIPRLDLEGTTPVTPEVIAQAVADVGCKTSSGLVDTYIKALYAAEKDLAAKHADELAAYVSAQQERVRNASKALGE